MSAVRRCPLTRALRSAAVLAALAIAAGLDAASAAEPSERSRRTLLTEACLLAGQEPGSVAALVRAEELARTFPDGPDRDRAEMLTGEILSAQRRWLEAAPHFARARRSDDRTTAQGATLREAECRAAAGDTAAARKLLHALGNAPSYVAADSELLRVAILLAERRVEEAAARLEVVASANPARRETAEMRRLRAFVAIARGQSADALPLLADMEDATARLFRGLALDATGRTLPSAGLFAGVANGREATAAPAALLAARAFERSGDLAGAEAALRRFLDRFASDPAASHARLWLASTLLRRGEVAAALAESSPLEGDAGSAYVRPHARLISSEALRRSGRPGDALGAYRRALSLGLPPGLEGFGYEGLARAAFQSGEPALAAQALEKVASGAPRDDLAAEARLLLGLARHRAHDPVGAVTIWLSLLDQPCGIVVRERALLAAAAAMTESADWQRIVSVVPFRFASLETSAPPAPARLSRPRARILLHLGGAYRMLSLARESAAVYARVSAAAPDAECAALACEGRAFAALLAGRPAEARKTFEELRDRHTRVAGRSEPARLVADAAFLDRRYADAAAQYEAAFRTGRLDAAEASDVRHRAALAYREQGYLTQAIEIWSALAKDERDPERAMAHVQNAAHTHFLAHRFREAAAAYESLLARNPRSALRRDALLGVGRARLSAGETDAAAKAFADVVAIGGDDAAVRDALAGLETASYRLMRGKKNADATTTVLSLRSFLERFPDSALAADVRIRLGSLLLDSGKTAEAEAAFREVVERHPGMQASGHALLGLGAVAERLNRPDEAVARYGQLIASFPDSGLVPDATLSLASLHFAAGRHEDALARYRSLVQDERARLTDAQRGTAHHNAGLCLAALRRDVEAAKSYRDAAAAFAAAGPDGAARAAEARVRAAVLAFDAGRHAEAAAALRPITGALSGAARAEALDVLGESSAQLQRMDEAASAWRKLEVLAPANDPHRLHGLARLAELYETQGKKTAARRLYRAIAESGAGAEWIEVASSRLAKLGN